MGEEFISEKIQAVTNTMDTRRMAVGEPGLPKIFNWRGKPLEVKRVVRQWKEAGDCTHGSGEKYTRKFWYELKTPEGATATVYFLKPAKRNLKDAGWWLFSFEERKKIL